MKYSVKEFA